MIGVDFVSAAESALSAVSLVAPGRNFEEEDEEEEEKEVKPK